MWNYIDTIDIYTDIILAFIFNTDLLYRYYHAMLFFILEMTYKRMIALSFLQKAALIVQMRKLNVFLIIN